MPKKVLLFSALLLSVVLLSACTPEPAEEQAEPMQETMPAAEDAMYTDEAPADPEMIREMTGEGEPEGFVPDEEMTDDESMMEDSY